MGIAIPQVVSKSTTSGSGVQVIDGGLKFDEDNNNYLKVTPGSNGNRRTWTWSGWVKRNTFGSSLMSRFFMGGTTSVSSGNVVIAFYQDRLFWQIGSSSERITTNRLFRDTGWYHIVVALDTTQGTSSDRVKIYVNGQQETSFSTSGYPSQNTDSGVNSTQGMLLGAGRDSGGNEPDGPFDGQISNSYLIDGLALGPGYFGFTDPLTNTWKPKKFRAEGTTVNDGTTWSSGIPGNTLSGYPATNAFDGNTSNYVYADVSSTMTWTASKKITGQLIEVYVYAGNTHPIVLVNGQSTGAVVGGNAQQGVWVDVTDLCGGPGGTLSTITAFGQNIGGTDRQSGFSAVRVDGVILIDSTTTNLSFGTNGFYLPLDGNSPIGQDQSGQGNDFTPINFGGSVALDNPQVSGARPILNTTQGGTQAGVGVFGSKQNVGYAVTVYNDGGGNKYYIDGVKQDTVTGLIRGATYTFDTSDSTVSSHPFRFSATSNGSHGGGSEYINGVTAITGAATTITVPHDAPNTLYYYCLSHSGMGADITGITTNEKLADQYASNCVLALPLVGANSDVSASIACTASTKAMTNVGNAAGVTTESNFYNGSFVFDGTGDGISTPNSTDYAFGTGDFTVECWWYINVTNTNQVFIENWDSPSTGWQLYFRNSGDKIAWYVNSGILIEDTNAYTTGKWHHAAVCRSNGTTKLYIDGDEKASASDSTNYSTTEPLSLGRQQSTSTNHLNGYLQDVRVYKGVAKYTTDFVIPATFPDILPDTPSGVSGSSKLTKITEGAVSFDGTGDYLSIADDTDLELSNGDFTIEGYYYFKNTGSSGTNFWGKWASTPGRSYAFSYVKSSGKYIFGYSTNGTNETLSAEFVSSADIDRWVHFAAVRNGTSLKVYRDGKEIINHNIGTTTIYNSSASLMIGRLESNSNYDLNGFVSNFRLIKGTALYTSDFTPPPTAPLTDVTNTKLLCCQSNTSAGSAAVSPNLGGVNDGTVWSSYLSSAAGLNSSQGAPLAFDGSTTTKATTPQNTGGYYTGETNALEFIPPSSIAFSSSVKVRGRGTGQTTGKARIDTGSGYGDVIDLSTDGLETLVSGSGNLVKLKVWTITYSGENELAAIEIDGTNLLDPVTANGDVAATNFNPFITDINAVRGQETGYATLNPLNNNGGTLSNGNLSLTSSGAANVSATLQIPTTGKYYWEYLLDGLTSGGVLGIADGSAMKGTALGDWTKIYGYSPNGNKYENASASSYGATLATGDLVGVKYDADTRELEFLKNNISQGVAYTVSSDYDYYPSIHGNIIEVIANFGQKPFKFPPPEGYQPLNAANTRPVKVISRPDQYVGVTTYSGNSSSSNFVTDLNFNSKPDFVWIKSRSGSSSPDTQNHYLVDSVRGANGSVTKKLYSNSSGAENDGQTDANNGIKFIRNGFELTSDNDGTNDANAYVAWAWKAGGNKNTFNVDDVGYATAAAAGLTAGSMSPTGASVGTKQGFSIIGYTGNGSSGTMPHGLNQAPTFVVAKNRDASANWFIFSPELGSNGALQFSALAEYTANPVGINATSSTTFTLGGARGETNTLNEDYIAYLWHDVPGLQKFGKYSGTGSSGNFIELGFRPALLMIKSTAAYGWAIVDTTRSDYNVKVASLYPNKTDAEFTGSGHEIDYLSNGFNLRNSNDRFNKSSTNYIYAAWAEAPTVDLFGGGANAR